MLNNAALLVSLSLVSFSTIADDWNTITDTWAEGEPTEAGVVRFKGDTEESYLKTTNGVYAKIGHDTRGRQNLYLSFINTDEESKCTHEDTPNTGVAIVNGQAVRMYQHCEQEDFISGITMWAYSEQGKDFLIKAFQTSPKTVRVEYGSFKLDVPAVGFTQSWANAGGDAL